MRGIPPPTPPVWSLRSSRNFQRLELKLFLAFRHLVRAAYNRPPTPPVLSLRSARNFSRAASRCSRAFRHPVAAVGKGHPMPIYSAVEKICSGIRETS